MSHSTILINGNGKYNVKLDYADGGEPNYLKIETSDGVTKVLLGFDTIGTILAFQSSITEALVKGPKGSEAA